MGCTGCTDGADGCREAEGTGVDSAEEDGVMGSVGTNGTNALGRELRPWRCDPREAAPRNPDAAGRGVAGAVAAIGN